jgi:hypothetical protein
LPALVALQKRHVSQLTKVLFLVKVRVAKHTDSCRNSCWGRAPVSSATAQDLIGCTPVWKQPVWKHPEEMRPHLEWYCRDVSGSLSCTNCVRCDNEGGLTSREDATIGERWKFSRLDLQTG